MDTRTIICAGLGQTHVARRACRRIWQRTRKHKGTCWAETMPDRRTQQADVAVSGVQRCSAGGWHLSVCQMARPARQDSDSDSLLTPAVGNLGNQSMKAQQGLGWAENLLFFLWFSAFRSQKIHHSRFTIMRQATSNQLIIRVWSGDGWVNWWWLSELAPWLAGCLAELKCESICLSVYSGLSAISCAVSLKISLRVSWSFWKPLKNYLGVSDKPSRENWFKDNRFGLHMVNMNMNSQWGQRDFTSVKNSNNRRSLKSWLASLLNLTPVHSQISFVK